MYKNKEKTVFKFLAVGVLITILSTINVFAEEVIIENNNMEIIESEEIPDTVETIESDEEIAEDVEIIENCEEIIEDNADYINDSISDEIVSEDSLANVEDTSTEEYLPLPIEEHIGDFTWSISLDGTLRMSGRGGCPPRDICNYEKYNKIVKKAYISLPDGRFDYLFTGFENLTMVDLSNSDASSLILLDALCTSCPKLTDVYMPIGKDSSCLFSSRTFYDCPSLQRIHNLESFSFKRLIRCNATFYGCKSLEELDISGFPIGPETECSDMFYGCDSLKSLKIPTNVTVDIDLPCKMKTPDGTVVTKIPNVANSIILTRCDQKDPEGPETEVPEKQTEGIQLPYSKLTLGINSNNKTISLFPLLTDEEKLSSVVWSVKDENGNKKKGAKYLTVKNGVLTANKKGVGHTVYVTAKIKRGKKYYESVTFAVKIVNKPNLTLPETFISGSGKSSYKIPKKSKGIKLSVMGCAPGNKKVKWTSSNKKIATVSSSGKVVPKKKGTTLIKATVGKLTQYYTVTVY